MVQHDDIVIPVKTHTEQTALPRYMSAGASGMDVCAQITEPKRLAPLERALIPTGLFFAIPVGFELQVRPRSGLALKHGITCLNTPGTIDADYRGEVKVLLVNLSSEPFTIAPGERIAQLVCAKVQTVRLERVDILPDTVRGEGGFGHTGR
jgi:dUTP pyrophosphatase